MALFSKKTEARFIDGLKRFQPILSGAKTRDVNEADTVVIVTDLLADLLGYDKYAEITREYSVRGTFCDLAVKMEDKPRLLLEVKAIGLDLKEAHIKQAVDYAANLGVEWTVLTNGALWQVYKITFGKPIDQDLVLEFDLLTLNARTPAHLDLLFPLSREGILKSALNEYHTQRQAMSRFSLAALLLSEPMLKILRRELRRLSPGVNVESEDVKIALMKEVLKREVVEGEKADEARKRLQRALKKQMRATAARSSDAVETEPVEEKDDEEVTPPDMAVQDEASSTTEKED